MKRALVAISLAALGACAPAAPPAVAPPSEHAPAAACEPVRLAFDGIVGCMPGPFTEMLAEEASDPRGIVARLSTPTFKARFSLSRERVASAEDLVKDPSPAGWRRVDATRAIQVGGFSGRAAEGLADERTRVATRTLAVGDSLYTAEVRWDDKQPHDAHLVSVFLDGFRVDPSWRVFVSTEGAYSVALPEPSIGTEKRDADGTLILLRVLGGVAQRTYAIAVADTPPNDKRTMDDFFEEGMRRIVAKPGRAVLKTGDVFLDGSRGHEVTCKDEDGTFLRLRMFVAQRRVYAVVATARALDALSAVESARFLDSFQVLHP
jgi:hypothetical protein